MNHFGAQNFMTGLMQGYEFVDRTMARKRQEERAMEAENLLNEMRNAQLDAMRSAQEAREFNRGMRLAEYNRDLNEQAKADKVAKARTYLARIASGLPVTPDMVTFFQENQAYSPVDLAYLTDPSVVRAASVIMDAAEGKRSFRELTDPSMLPDFDKFLKPDLNTDRDGNPLKGNRELVRLAPGKQPGTFIAGVRVDGGDEVPVTARRGTEQDGDNEVLQQDIRPVLRRAQGVLLFNNALKQNPKAQETARTLLAAIGVSLPAKNKAKGDPVIKAAMDERELIVKQLTAPNMLPGSEQYAALVDRLNALNQVIYTRANPTKPAPAPVDVTTDVDKTTPAEDFQRVLSRVQSGRKEAIPLANPMVEWQQKVQLAMRDPTYVREFLTEVRNTLPQAREENPDLYKALLTMAAEVTDRYRAQQ